MKTLKNIAMAMAATAGLLAFSAPAHADAKTGSFEYHGGKQKFDRKIEAAAIRRAAEKIGDLRGSLEGNRDAYIVDPEELGREQSSHLGFPIMQIENRDFDSITGSVPII